jgi:hypothetical protein
MNMIQNIEIQQINPQYEHLRLANADHEARLLDDISRQGIQEPVRCVHTGDDQWFLLDGFKRLRCCRKLHIHKIEVISLSAERSDGWLQVLRQDHSKGLHILEQASVVSYLHKEQKMAIKDIARAVNRSISWVSMRVNLIESMSVGVKEAVFSGKFPLRSFMYSVRPFTRVTNRRQDVDDFVSRLSGQGLSTRQVDDLAKAYFQNNSEIKEQLFLGKISHSLARVKEMKAQTRTDKLSKTPWEQLRMCFYVVRKLRTMIQANPVMELGVLNQMHHLFIEIFGTLEECRKLLASEAKDD